MDLKYVKFQRGSQTAYNNLQNVNEDTLYFIYNKNKPEDGGLLYLGRTLIGGTGIAGAKQLAELEDVDLAALPSGYSSLADGMILQYNTNTNKWEPNSIKKAVENAGAEFEISGIVIKETNKNDNESFSAACDRVNQDPHSGDIVFVNNIPYVYNGTNWKKLYGEDLDSRLNIIENDISELQSKTEELSNELQSIDGKIANEILNANHLKYQIVENDLPPVPTSAEAGTLDNIVFLKPNGEESGNNKFDEYMFINGSYEKIGNWQADLTNYITTDTFNTQVGLLNDQISNLQSNLNNYVLQTQYITEVGDFSKLNNESTSLVDEIINIKEQLVWNEIKE